MCRIRGAPPRSGVLDFNFLQHKTDIGNILCSNFAVYAIAPNRPIGGYKRFGSVSIDQKTMLDREKRK